MALFSSSRLGISFAYYGVILASTELLERNLVCGSGSEAVVSVGGSEESTERSQSPCYCHTFSPSDYRTMIISTVGEVACKCVSVAGGGQATQSLRGEECDPRGPERLPGSC